MLLGRVRGLSGDDGQGVPRLILLSLTRRKGTRRGWKGIREEKEGRMWKE